VAGSGITRGLSWGENLAERGPLQYRRHGVLWWA